MLFEMTVIQKTKLGALMDKVEVQQEVAERTRGAVVKAQNLETYHAVELGKLYEDLEASLTDEDHAPPKPITSFRKKKPGGTWEREFYLNE